MTTPNQPTNDAPLSSRTAADGRPTKRWTILLVDDEPDILGSIKLVLERSKNGVQVLTAGSGAEGLEILARTEVDLLISDFKMPAMDGLEFLAKSRELKPQLPRIMFTAYADAELARRAFAEAFVVDFLPKTLQPRQLLDRVDALLAEHAGGGGADRGLEPAAAS